MLNPKENRIDYGDKLRPPTGYELSYAIATTFSVELETLLLLPVALAFENALIDGQHHDTTLSTLEAVSHIKGRVKVFFQQGNIKVPTQFSRLFTLLEPCLVPVVPVQVFSSFHPKCWLIRFTDIETGKKVKYRLLVLSRNLTSSRCWDLAVALEGELGTTENHKNSELLEFVHELKRFDRNFAGFKLFSKEIPQLKWQVPPGFRDLRFLVGSPQKRPVDFGQGTNSLLVMSPFLHPRALEFLQTVCDGPLFLFSRAEELDLIGKKALKQWQCYVLNEAIINGEDALDNDRAMPQNLHAKLILAQNGNTTHWHIGSANATIAALGSNAESDLPRNTEFMLRLSTSNDMASLSAVMNELVGLDDQETRIFVRHSFSEACTDHELLNEKVRRKLIYKLISAEWLVKAESLPDDQYQCEVIAPAGLNACGFSIEVGQLAIHDFKPIHERLIWSNMRLTQVSAFIPVRIINITETKEAKVAVEFVIRASLDIAGGDQRQQQIISELLNSEKKFMHYVAMLLQPDEQLRGSLEPETNGISRQSDADWSQVLDGPILELLLKGASRHPERLDRIHALMIRLENANVPIPDTFRQLWQHFKGYVRSRL